MRTLLCHTRIHVRDVPSLAILMFGSAITSGLGAERYANHYHSFGAGVTSEGRFEAVVTLYGFIAGEGIGAVGVGGCRPRAPMA
jgi:hypothetical protein